MNEEYREELAPLRVWTPILLVLVLIVAASVVLLLLYIGAIGRVFRLLGLSPLGAILLLVASLVGSMINIPLTRRRLAVEDPALASFPVWLRQFMPMFYYFPPVVVEQVIALNVGGAIIPIAMSIYLFTLPTTPWIAAVAATIIVAVVTKLLARPVPGHGIELPAIIPLLITAITAHFLVAGLGGAALAAAPVAYISGTLGTLIGADILNLPRVLRGSLLSSTAKPIGHGDASEVLDEMEQLGMPSQRTRRVVSIGGAGVFDGIFVTSTLAPLLAVL
ncbi:MAG: DUF1614 domain-containing protein [Ktedonobacterales bacterium]